MDAAGRVVTALDEDAVRVAAQQLLEAGCEAVVVHFLHAYANPAHELRAGEVLRELWPNDYITLGHALLSESREFERGVTAAVNASVQPLLARYIRQLEAELSQGRLCRAASGDERQWRHGVLGPGGGGGGEDGDVGASLRRDGGGLCRARGGNARPDHL